ncbi:MAG: threonine synthase [Clostridia bacterium]|nr:threonine synthase [Clostridia bacterium]
MKYTSTRNPELHVTAAQAIAQGISEEGGLFVPESFPAADLNEMLHLDYIGRAKYVLSRFLTDFTEEEIAECAELAYAAEKFEFDTPAKVVSLDSHGENKHILELWHGPTCAFKDMALQILPHLLTKSLKKTADGKTAVILVATSGDTGKAALEGFKDVPGTEMIVFYPENGVSPMQKRQMNTQEGGNVCVCAIEGNFDDAQTGVKKIFTDEAVKAALKKNNKMFSSANSINWGRLLPQIVYYFSAYLDLVNAGKVELGDAINVVVPTGNFGNILAAYYAKQMGLPVKKFICASNSNNILTDFIRTGVYDKKREFHTTISPSMDILVSSNLERLLYHLCGKDSEKLTSWMNALATGGNYTVDADTADAVTELFYGGCCDDRQTVETIRRVFCEDDYLCDTHTAVAMHVYGTYCRETGDETPTVIVSTASPYKFSDSVLNAFNADKPEDEFEEAALLSEMTGTEIPLPILALQGKAVRFNNLCAADEMPGFVMKTIGV